jgi:p-hydroxybenzoate 3-monooxygenase
MSQTRIPVGIVGAGPAGLLLGHLLHLAGIESVTLELRSEEHVTERVRAGVLEQTTVDLFRDAGLAERLFREGLRHEGVWIAFAGRRHRVDLAELTGGRAITVYGQNEVIRDLLAARRKAGGELFFNATDLTVTGLDSDRPHVRAVVDGKSVEWACDYVAGCDGFHGICRSLIPDTESRAYSRVYPYGWLGILAEAPPSSDELVYSLHERGFALFSMRTSHMTRLYLQCEPEEQFSEWPDDRIWDELTVRLGTGDGWAPHRGPIIHKSVTGMRSFVVEPMQYHRLFLAGDAAHIVPPTGAKGLNLAVADVWHLARGFAHRYRTGSDDMLDGYSADALRRAWRAQRFSYWMTSLLHRSPTANQFDRRRQVADLEYLVSSRAAMTTLAENYVGLPLE